MKKLNEDWHNQITSDWTKSKKKNTRMAAASSAQRAKKGTKRKKTKTTFDKIVSQAIQSNSSVFDATSEIYRTYRSHMTIEHPRFEQYDEQQFNTWVDEMVLAQKKVSDLTAYVEKLSEKNMTETERMRNMLNNLSEGSGRTIDEIYDSVIKFYKAKYFDAAERDKGLPGHIKASKKHSSNIVDQAVSDLITQVAFEYGTDQTSAEDMAFDFALEVGGGKDKVDNKGNLHVTNLYVMMDDDLNAEVQRNAKSTNDMLGKFFNKESDRARLLDNKVLLKEGTWAWPNSPELMEELIKILDRGARTRLSLEELYDYIGDDDFFDKADNLLDQDSNADLVPLAINKINEWIEYVTPSETEWDDGEESVNEWHPKAISMWNNWMAK